MKDELKPTPEQIESAKKLLSFVSRGHWRDEKVAEFATFLARRDQTLIAKAREEAVKPYADALRNLALWAHHLRGLRLEGEPKKLDPPMTGVWKLLDLSTHPASGEVIRCAVKGCARPHAATVLDGEDWVTFCGPHARYALKSCRCEDPLDHGMTHCKDRPCFTTPAPQGESR
jgi:hypothetical protein